MDFIHLGKYFFVAAAFTFFLLPVIIKLLERYQILESPDHRKVHQFHTPSMGGVPVFLGFISAMLIGWNGDLLMNHKLFLGALLLMFIIGLRDDLIPLKASHKLISQLIPVLMICFSGKGLITSFYGLFGAWDFPLIVSIVITAFTIIVIINSINLIDGADGLAGTIAIIILSFFTVWFYLVGQYELAILSATFIGSLVAFLYYNWQPSKIFMGDTGALMIGIIISYLTIQFLNINYQLPESSFVKFSATIGTSFCILIIPLFDTLRVFIIRVINKRSPFSPDKNHVHHELMKRNFSHAQLSLLLGSINILFIIAAALLRGIPDAVMIPLVLILCLLLNILIGTSFLSRITSSKNKLKPTYKT